jgi:hypothetical protein
MEPFPDRDGTSPSPSGLAGCQAGGLKELPKEGLDEGSVILRDILQFSPAADNKLSIVLLQKGLDGIDVEIAIPVERLVPGEQEDAQGVSHVAWFAPGLLDETGRNFIHGIASLSGPKRLAAKPQLLDSQRWLCHRSLFSRISKRTVHVQPPNFSRRR